jgi:uncharacterized protein (DUF342 family)
VGEILIDGEMEGNKIAGGVVVCVNRLGSSLGKLVTGVVEASTELCSNMIGSLDNEGAALS